MERGDGQWKCNEQVKILKQKEHEHGTVEKIKKASGGRAWKARWEWLR